MENNTVNYNVATGEITHSYIKPIEINEEIVIDYEQEVESLIRQRYTSSQEFSILRQKEEKPTEYQEYYEYCEECKRQVQAVM